ncbi:PepSY domain-containing protein [Comamonas sp. A7-5]|uniref:PepSY domain-containing protein n=1 Tax=Comamonas sp. A7-5 TaxID=673549 RepID=UPI0031D985E4
MWTSAQAKRLVFLVHRWTGVGACVLMALWLFSGVVMLFVGYPKLLPTERLQALPSLSTGQSYLPVEAALKQSQSADKVQQIVLTTIAGRPSYRLKEADGTLRVVDAGTGVVVQPPDDATALRTAKAFLSGANGVLQGRTQDDRWTHSASLDPHRPLIKVLMDDSASSLLYISSTTAEVVLDVPRHQRYWNYVGAWLHWVYMVREGSKDPVWSWLVIGLSALGTVSAIAGALVGIWRWRFNGRYKSGAKTPYREFQMRWHHITGLVFGAMMICWIFSGLMSMNPLGIFSPQGPRPDLRAYQHAGPGSNPFRLTMHEALTLLSAEGFDTREVEWEVLDGQPYLLAFNGLGETRIVSASLAAPQVERELDRSKLEQAAKKLFPFAIRSTTLLNEYDAYYYRRGEASMYSAAARDLPVLRMQFEDPGNTIVYISPYSGDVVLSLDQRQRAGRWLFNFLHSWDLPWMLRHAWPRDAILVLLSIGTLALALTGIVLGYRRLKLLIGHKRRF